MIQVIRSADRYHVENEWLSAYWHFSFADYHDPANVSFGPLRVFNNDTVAPGGGFPFHPHCEMEIVTYLIQGQLEHRDTMGNTGTITPGEVQRMSAGTGLRHSEFNPSETEPTQLVQLWLFPAVPQLTPSWEQKRYPLEERAGKLLPIAVPAGSIRGERKRDTRGEREQDTDKPPHAVEIHQDATIYTSLLGKDEFVTHSLMPAKAGLPAEASAKAGRRAYIFVINGELDLNGQTLRAGDQARITDEHELRLSGPSNGAAPADFLLLNLP
jgi:redox-sensitive bicupin YhaK (pirin superfamily)